ncbi:RHS repeat-associated core domain-containing protein [Cystobacter fuscus]|uniref:RHS repeat-associated core domain-containing protein n=1 Tax=Cystobacter fuscus TaxID=43 RepID=UPI002B2E4879|nr:hypothetical protein F0U63_21395 [Cystobacter fuscus]
MKALLLVALAAGCGRDTETTAPASAQAPAAIAVPAKATVLRSHQQGWIAPAGVATESARLGAEAGAVCDAMPKEQVSPAWRSGTLVGDGDTQSARFRASEGEPGLLVTEVEVMPSPLESPATVTLNGVVIPLAANSRLQVKRVSLKSLNDLEVVTQRGFHVRVSVAATNALPCVLADVGPVSEPQVTREQTFSLPDPWALGVLVVDLHGAGANASVVFNGELMRDGMSPTFRGSFAKVVELRGTNTLQVTSLGKHDSAVRAAVFNADTLPPMFELMSNEGDDLSTIGVLTVEGIVDTDVTAVSVSGVPASVSAGFLSAEVPLVEGTNAIVTAARDFCGNVARTCRAVEYDSMNPVVTVSGVLNGETRPGPINLSWSSSDARLVSTSVTLDGVPFTGTSVSSVGPHDLVVTATDRSGRSTSKWVQFTIHPGGPVISVSGVHDGVVARPRRGEVVITFSSSVTAQLSATLDGVPIISGTNVVALGNHFLRVKAVSGGVNGGVSSTGSLSFVIDGTSPKVTFSDVEEGSKHNQPVSVKFSATDAHLLDTSVSASVDGLPFASGALVSSEGNHTLEVVAKDRAGYVVTSQRQFTLDYTPPDVQVSGVVDDSLGRETVTPIIQVTDLHPAQTEVSLNGNPFSSGTPVSGDGEYLLSVKATDAAGNKTSLLRHFSIDKTAPDIEVDGIQDGHHYKNAVTLVYTALDTHINSSSTSATLNGQPFETGGTVSTPGEYTLVVTARDTLGNSGSKTFRFVLDFEKPRIQLTGVADGGFYKAPVTPVVSVEDSYLDKWEMTLDGQPLPPGTAISGPEMSHTLVVTARDRAGNEERETFHFTLDFTAPEVHVTGIQKGERRNTSATISYSVQELNLEAVTALVDHQDVFQGGTSATVSAPGKHSLVITALDKAGHETVEKFDFEIDTTPPEISVESPNTYPDTYGTSSSEVELVVSVRDDGPLGAVSVAGGPLVRGTDGKYRKTLPLNDGLNTFQVVAYDEVGNSKTLPVSVLRDGEAPRISVSTPAEGAFVGALSVNVVGKVEDETYAGAKVQLTLAGSPVAVAADGTFSTGLTLQQGYNTLQFVATDKVGNKGTLRRTFLANATPPTLTLSEPAEGFTFTGRFVTVRGVAKGADAADKPTVLVEGQPAAVGSGGAFSYSLEVPALGERTIAVRVTDRYGLQTEVLRRIVREASADGGSDESDAGVEVDAGTRADAGTGPDAGTRPDAGTGSDAGTPPGQDGGSSGTDAGTPFESAPSLVVEAPADGAVLGGTSFTVTGRVQDGTLPLQVMVNDVPAVVSSRYFNATLALESGDHPVVIKVTDARQRTATVTRHISVDRSKPDLKITEPSTNPALVSKSPYVLKGTVWDAHLAGVWVQGVPAVVIAGGFSAPVSLKAGSNSISVEARDLAGNREVLVQELSIPSVPPELRIVTPADGAESPTSKVLVQAEVTSGTPPYTVNIGTEPATRGASGLFEAQVSLMVGENTLRVSVSDSLGLSSERSVVVRYRQLSSEPLVVTDIEPKTGATDVETDALVSVAFNKPVDPTSITPDTFVVQANGSRLAGGFSVAPGAQTVTFVAQEPLPPGQRLTVRIQDVRAPAGSLGMSGTFGSEFTVRRPLTLARGVVLDERLQPLSGVRVEAVGQGLSTRTGPDGNWALLGVQGDRQVELRFEGGLSSEGRAYTTVRRQLFITQEKETQDRPLILIPLQETSAQHVNGAAGGEVTFGGVHGAMKLKVPEGGLAFADGSTSGVLTATEVPTYARPVPMEDRVAPSALWQLGPERVQFLRAIHLTLPNRTQLESGRMVVLLAFDERRLALKRVGFGHVNGEAIESDGDISVTSMELFGYMELTPKQQELVEAALASAGGSTGGGSPGGTGSPGGAGGTGSALDGGLGRWVVPPPATTPASFFGRLGELLIGTSHAQLLLAGIAMGFSAMDTVPFGPAHIWGDVRTPRAVETKLTLTQPNMVPPPTGVVVNLPLAEPIAFTVQYDSDESVDLPGATAETVIASLSAKGPDGLAIGAEPGEQWVVQGVDEVTLSSRVYLPLGTSTIKLSGRTRFAERTLLLTARLEPIAPDAGETPTQARLTFTQEADSFDSDKLQGAVRFGGLRVNITSASDGVAATEANGRYSTLMQAPAVNTMGIACAEVPLGNRYLARLDSAGNTHFDSVPGSFATCSPTFMMSPSTSSRADVLVDLRMLFGTVTFKNRDGRAVPAVCQDVTQTEWDTATGELRSISEQDVATTEVHFFREDNLELPIAQYTVAHPNTEECADPDAPPPGNKHGYFSRVRLGPTSTVSRGTRERCAALALKNPRTPEEDAFLKSDCSANGSSFLRLSTGDRLVVFAVNHATGYTGMSTVVVPPINREARREDGTCPQDAQGKIPIQEGNQTFEISHCTQQELGIGAQLDMFPPEIDVRVERRAGEQGLSRSGQKNLIRTGGAGTTRDDFVQVSTHWRVRPTPAAGVDGGSGIDGGVASRLAAPGASGGETCVRGLRSDGGACSPGALVDDDADAGLLLQVYCSELPPGATEEQLATCLRDSEQLSDVPKGVPPLAGRIVRVTNSADEQVVVSTFPVAPGQSTVNVQTAQRTEKADGKQETRNNLIRANYYLHVVGNRLLGQNTGSGPDAPPPGFQESDTPGENPPGMPAKALYLKNVFKRNEGQGQPVARFDLSREHEFRILDLEPQRVTAHGDGKPRDLNTDDQPAAKERDLSYEFLATLLEPGVPGRAGTLSGQYRVRLGGDDYGIDCPLEVNAADNSITANCDGEFIGDVLSANDILYIELYLSGNSENILYRFNFYGLAARKDRLTASAEFTAEAAVEPDAADGTPANGRPVSQLATTNFFVEPALFKTGVVKLCTNESCSPENRNLLKEVTMAHQPDGSYKVTETGRGLVKQELQQESNFTSTGARRFKLPLPAHLASMPGSANAAVPVFLVLETTKERTVKPLGKPQGSYNGANTLAVGQETVAGVNLADGHLSLEHSDFSIPFPGGGFGFSRLYTNTDNEPNPLGRGWTHNFQGFVFEEKVGRYIVILGGQGFVFPSCTLDPDKEDYGSVTTCKTDNTHGFDLSVTAPLKLKDHQDVVLLTMPDGRKLEFNRKGKKASEEGKRQWFLTGISDGHGRGDDLGWTRLTYEGDTDRLASVEHKAEVGAAALLFTYEEVDTSPEQMPEEIRRLVRNDDFQWLKSVQLRLTHPEGTYTDGYKVTFSHDVTGNLTRAARALPGFSAIEQPLQIYKYDYLPVADSLGPTEKRESFNELNSVQRIHGANEFAEEFVQWRATYERTATRAPYPHLKTHEMVTEVSTTGMQGEKLQIDYPTSRRRVVTRPDGVVLTLMLNPSGNVNSTTSPTGVEGAVWGSDARGGPVFSSELSSPSGRKLLFTPDSRMRLTNVALAPPSPGTRPVAGLENGGELARFILDSTFGVPSSSTLPQATVASPRNERGDLLETSLAAGSETYKIFEGLEYDPDGVLKQARDAQGRRVLYEDFNSLGQPRRITLTLSVASGDQVAVRELEYDVLGRVLRSEDVRTREVETFTYDGLGRVLTHTRSGSPQEAWTYVYTEGNETLQVVETLAQVSATGGTTAAHKRTLEYADGLLRSERFLIGDPAREVSRSYTYVHGKQDVFTDEMGKSHQSHYDSAGRLWKVTSGALTEAEYTLDAEGRPYFVTDALGRRTTIDYDALGRAVYWDWGDGDTEEVELDSQGTPVRRLLGGQHAVTLSDLDPLGNPRLTRSEAARGGVNEKRGYDKAGRLVSSRDEELGLEDTYEYKDVLGRLTKHVRTVQSMTRGLKLEEVHTYLDAQSNGGRNQVRVERKVDTGTEPAQRSETVLYTLDTAGRVLEAQRTVDGRLATDTFEYTERGQVWKHTSPREAGTTTRRYDPMGNLVQVTDEENHVTRYTLDNAGRVEVESGPHPGFKATYVYDELGRLKSKTVDAYGIPAQGNAAATMTPEAKWTYTYHPDTHEVVETASVGANPSTGSQASPIITRRRFNARDRLVREEVSDGNGSRTSVVLLDGPWEKSISVSEGDWLATTTYDPRDDRGRVLKEVEEWRGGGQSYRYQTETNWTLRTGDLSFTDDAGGRHEEYSAKVEVDSLVNVVKMEQGGRTDAWLYDAAGVLAKSAPAGAPATLYSYDEGLLKKVSSGGEETSYEYYADGRVKARNEPSGRRMEYDYWARGLVKQTRYGLPSDTASGLQTTDFTYDPNGALLTVAYGNGQSWTHKRGARGELLGVTQPGQERFTYQYDALLRLTAVVPPTGSATRGETFAYDFLGRQTQRARGGAKWVTTWSGGLGTRMDGNQDTVKTLMDGRGRVARVTYLQASTPADAPPSLGEVAYAYTSLDQPWNVVEKWGASTQVVNAYTYDARRRLNGQTRGTEGISYTYTASDQRETVTSAAGTVTYGYDSTTDRLESINGPAGLTELKWEPGGERLTVVSGGGLVERRCYDGRGRLRRVLNAATDPGCDGALASVTQLHSGFEYEYDERGNRTKEMYLDAQLSSGLETTEYGYDEADRLTGVRYPGGRAVLYQLGSDGSRLREKEAVGYSGVLTPAGFEAASASRHWRYGFDARGGLEGIYDELNRDGNGAATRTATYVTDPVGRLVLEDTAGVRKEYKWDAAGRLVRAAVQPKVAGAGGAVQTATYAYGWDGLRVSRTAGGVTTGYLWADGELQEERLPGGAQLYAQGAGLTVAVGAARVAHDGLGSAVGQAGATDTHSRYDAWGGYRKDASHWKVPGSAEASLGYTGHAFDADVDLVYAQQRWYHPALGRFLSEDPVLGNLDNPTGLHPFAYAKDNPTGFVDPDGRIPVVSGLIGGAVGGIIGCGVGALGGQKHGCFKGAAAGASAGFMAGLTGGASLLGSALVGGAGMSVASGLDAYYEGRSNRGVFGATVQGFGIGAVAGVAGHSAGVLVGGAVGEASPYLGLTMGLTEGFVDNALSQNLSVAAGLQQGEVDYFSPLPFIAGGMAAKMAAPSVARSLGRLNQALENLRQPTTLQWVDSSVEDGARGRALRARNVVADENIEAAMEGTTAAEASGGVGRNADFVSDLRHVSGRSAQVRNAWIQEILKKDIPNVRMTHVPQYNPFLSPFALAVQRKGTQIGKRSFASRRELIDTIVHEELHHRWWSRGIYGHHSPALDDKFSATVKRYMRMRGF